MSATRGGGRSQRRRSQRQDTDDTLRDPVAPLSESELRNGWISLSRAFELAALTEGGRRATWDAIRDKIQFASLGAGGPIDGVPNVIAPEWLAFLAWETPAEQRDVIWFDRAAAARKGVTVPNRVENVVIPAGRFWALWRLAAFGEFISLADACGLNETAPR